MKKIISGFILISLLSSCVTRRECDSTNTLTVIRDTTIYVKIPGDTVDASVSMNELFRVDTSSASLLLEGSKVPESSVLKSQLAISTVWLKDGMLHHRLAQRDTTVATTLKGALKTTHKTSQKTTRKTSVSRSQKEGTIQQTRYTNQLTGWQWTEVYLGRIFLGVLVVIFLWKVMKAVR